MFCNIKYLVVGVAFILVTIILVTHDELTSAYYADFRPPPPSPPPASPSPPAVPPQRMSHGVHEVGRKTERYDLSRQECKKFFPLLYTEINTAKSRGRIGKPPRKHDELGLVRARIHNRNLYVINRGEDVQHRQFAILSAIHRALMTAPQEEVVPDIEFTFCVNDSPQSNIWSLARSEAPGEVKDTWLMPDHAYWSWPEPHLGSLAEVRENITQQEKLWTWDDKIDKAVWRGSAHWNPTIRDRLLSVSNGGAWADIQELEWGKNELSMQDICKYRFLIYAEGATYSGRLKYLQLCRSVIITNKIQWKTMLGPLLIENGFGQNIELVKEDWSDLEDRIHWLQSYPQDAEKVAESSASTFRDLYLSNGAETCYWRELFRAWADVTDDVGDPTGDELGVRWEMYMLMGGPEWPKTG